MGEVYRARDTRLGREVAIKVLPAELAEDAERLARFEREAKLLAALSHPNIAHVYGFESGTLPDGSTAHFLAMELVEGEDLAERLKRGALPVDDALAVARQIAEALEEAHEKGIVHRDLKPANVKLAPDGKVTVLDFGLAKALAGEAGPGSAPDLSQSPTLAHAGTQAGVILGTAAYMSPEQARGRAVDRRADIWAFGVLLHEMLTGRQLFAGETVSDVLAGVLKTEVDLGALPAATPPAVRQLLRRCLERQPRSRLRDIGDARLVIEETLAGGGEAAAGAGEAAGARRGARGRMLSGALAAALLLLGAGLGFLAARGAGVGRAADAGPMPRVRFEVHAPEGTSLASGLALSPDGADLALVARGEDGRRRLWIRPLDAVEATPLPATEDAWYPFWAPDGRRLGYFAGNELRIVDRQGSSPRTIATLGPAEEIRGGSWGADDTIVYAPSSVGPLQRVSVAGGRPEPASRIEAGASYGTHRWPRFLPDGRRFVFYASAGSGIEPGILLLGEVGSLTARPLGPSTSMAVFAPPTSLLYVRGDALVSQRLDLDAGALVGEPVELGVTLPGGMSKSGLRSLAVSSRGALVYRADRDRPHRIVAFDRAGRQKRVIEQEPGGYFFNPEVSPDGRWLAVARYAADSPAGDIWLYDLERGLRNRFTFDDRDELAAVWSRDGRRLAVSRIGTGAAKGYAIVTGDREQPGRETPWLESESPVIAGAFTPDGRSLVYYQTGPDASMDLWIAPPSGEGAPQRLIDEPGSKPSFSLSPDGQWIAYSSDASRREEVYVRRLDGRGGATRVSPAGGSSPRWVRDGRELVFIGADGRLAAATFTPGDPPALGEPRALFQARDQVQSAFAVTPDGQTVVLIQETGDDSAPIVVQLGWQTLLEQQAGR